MLFFQYLLVALALCVDSFAVSTTCALKSKLSWARGLLLAVTFGVFQGGFPLLGALAGVAAERYVSSIDHWIAFGLLLAVGGKMIWDAFHDDDDHKALDVSSFGVICTLAVATSIDAFVVGIGFSFGMELHDIIYQVVMIALATMAISLLGVFLGKQKINISDRGITIFGGLVLIGLGTKILIEHVCGF